MQPFLQKILPSHNKPITSKNLTQYISATLSTLPLPMRNYLFITRKFQNSSYSHKNFAVFCDNFLEFWEARLKLCVQ